MTSPASIKSLRASHLRSPSPRSPPPTNRGAPNPPPLPMKNTLPILTLKPQQQPAEPSPHPPASVNHPTKSPSAPLPLLLHTKGATHDVKNNPNHQTAAWTNRHILAISQIRDADLETIAARARIVVDLQGGVVSHVFDFDFVVHGHCAPALGFPSKRVGAESGVRWGEAEEAGDFGCRWFANLIRDKQLSSLRSYRSRWHRNAQLSCCMGHLVTSSSHWSHS